MTYHEAGQFEFVGEENPEDFHERVVYNLLITAKGHGLKVRASGEGKRANINYSSIRDFMKEWRCV